MPPVTLIALVVGPIEPATKRGLPGFEYSSAAFRANSEASRLILRENSPKPVFRQNHRSAAERIRLDDVRPGCQIFAVNPQHDVRTGNDQILVATFQLRPAKILRRKILLLQHGAHGPIENEYPLSEQFAKGQALLDQVSHRLVFSLLEVADRAAKGQVLFGYIEPVLAASQKPLRTSRSLGSETWQKIEWRERENRSVP